MFFPNHIDALEVAVINSCKFELSLTRMMLQQAGARRVRCYDNPVEALREQMAEPSGLVMLDDKLPAHFTCAQLVRGMRLAALMPLCLTTIIVTSTTPTKGFVQEIVRGGANAVVVRPFSPGLLKTRISQVLSDRDKLEVRDGHYVMGAIIDSMEARELSSNPFMLAAVLEGTERDIEGQAALHTFLRSLDGAEPPKLRRIEGKHDILTVH